MVFLEFLFVVVVSLVLTTMAVYLCVQELEEAPILCRIESPTSEWDTSFVDGLDA